MALCRIYYFCSLEEAITLTGAHNFVYAKSGGDDALVIAWNKGTIERLIQTLNQLPDNWKYEYRPPDTQGNLPFFDCNLRRIFTAHQGTWSFETGVHFKPTDKLNRTDASSFWSWDHQEALLRSHLHRTAILCNTKQQTEQALNTLGTLLARRNHPMEGVISSFQRLNPTFLIEIQQQKTTLTPQNCPPSSPLDHGALSNPTPPSTFQGPCHISMGTETSKPNGSREPS